MRCGTLGADIQKLHCHWGVPRLHAKRYMMPQVSAGFDKMLMPIVRSTKHGLVPMDKPFVGCVQTWRLTDGCGMSVAQDVHHEQAMLEHISVKCFTNTG